MAASIPTSPEQRQRILELHGQGLGRNEIHRQTGVAAAVVTRIVTDAGFSFDRAATRAATSARQDDLAEKRSQALDGMYGQTLTVLQRLTSSAAFQTVMKGEYGSEYTATLDFIPARDYKELAAAAAQLALAANRLEQANNPQAEKVTGLLGEIAGQLGL